MNHKVINSNQEPLKWYIKILSENISKARTYPSLGKARSMYSELSGNYILINGNATEIVRISDQKLKYISARKKYEKSKDPNLLLDYTGYNNKYINNEIEKWISGINDSVISEATILDLFYWEQRMGNWGALFPAELDIATETISPFNCRSLLEVCLKVPSEHRKAPSYSFFKKVIKRLWPEVLSVPINPGPKGWGMVKKNIRELLPSGIVKSLQKVRN